MFQTKILNYQHIIFNFSETGDFYFLLRMQYFFIKSLYFRFYSLNQVLIHNYNFLQESFNSRCKFHLIFNLRRSFELSTLGFFFFNKKFGRVNFLKFNSVYEKFLLSLWNSILCPIFEVCSDRSSIEFRPFRVYQDSFFFIKMNILNKNKYFFFSKFVYFLSPNLDKVLLKSCFIPKNVLKSWFKFYLLEQNMNNVLTFSFIKTTGNLYYNFFNFLISGLVSF